MKHALVCLVLLTSPARAEPIDALLATLHRAQDALVLEGEAARPTHDRLVRMLDERLAGPGPHGTAGVVAYALSGGDPRIAARALSQIEQTARDAILVRGVLAHVSGRTDEARRLLALIRPERLRGRLAVLVAMAQAGTAIRAQAPDEARVHWNRVRLTAPGTLLEEAALRRLVDLALQRADAKRFFALLRRYWVRYPRSAFRERIVQTMKRSLASIDEDTMLAHLPRLALTLPERIRERFYADLARGALLNGHYRLATAVVRRKTRVHAPERTRMLKNLARLTGDDAARVHARLSAMSTATLSDDDRRLLRAARAIGRAMTAPVGARTAGLNVEGDLTRRHRTALDAADTLLVAR